MGYLPHTTLSFFNYKLYLRNLKMNSTAFDLNTDALVSSSHLVTFKDLHYALLTNDLPHRQFLKSKVPADKILTESFSMTTSTLEVSSTERICNYLRGMYDRYLTVTLAEFGLEKILGDLTSAKAQNNYTRFKEEYHDLNIDLIRCFTQIVTSIQQRDVLVFKYQDEEYKTHEVTLTRTLPGYGESYERVGCYLVTNDCLTESVPPTQKPQELHPDDVQLRHRREIVELFGKKPVGGSTTALSKWYSVSVEHLAKQGCKAELIVNILDTSITTVRKHYPTTEEKITE